MPGMNHRSRRPIVTIAAALLFAACSGQQPSSGSPPPSAAQAASPSSPATASASVKPAASATPSPSPKPVAWTKPVNVKGLAGCQYAVATVDDHGSTHIAAECPDDIRYATSSDGTTWTSTTFKAPKNRGDFGPQIAFDGNTLYLASTRYDTTEGGCGDAGLLDLGVYYRSRSLPDGEWSQPQRLGAVADELVAFRASDGLRAIVSNQKTGKQAYVTLVNGTLHEQPLAGAIGGDVSMRIGDDGKPQIVYSDSAGITYATLGPDGAPMDTSTIPHSGNGYEPSLVLAPGNVPAVMYNQGIHDGGCAEPPPPDDAGTYVATFDGGTWQPTRLTKNEDGSSLTFDPTTGELHVLLADRQLIHYAKAGDGDWKKEVIVKSGVGAPVIRVDPTTGNLVVVYSGDKGIEAMTRR